MSIRLIVGLGNPGRDYADTRHNIGFVVADAFVRAREGSWTRRREFDADVAKITQGAQRDLFVLKPQTFMNESGRAVAAFCRFFRIEPTEVVLIYDELNLDLGGTKLSIRGSAGGHNGVQSVLTHLGDGFRRFRLGIGPRQPPEIDLKDFVLGKFTPEQQTTLTQLLPAYLSGLDLILTQGVAAAMNRLNRRQPSDDRHRHQEEL
ncbi:MAG: aminoacyl-tRNA hydrolase [Opitutaceae bacterium]|nr:aminoacyl-tRNA hydrolase [Opitutaceae bacterium]